MSMYAVFDRIAPAANKVMACLWNGAAGRKLVVNRVYRFNWQVSAQTGVMLEQEIREVTARSAAGTSASILSEDVDDVLTASILAEHGGTWTENGGRGLLHRIFATNEEMVLAGANLAKDTALLHDAQLVYWRRPGSKGWTIPTGRGLAIKNITNSTIGTVSYRIEFDDLAVA
jgi:hypothetical protein